MSRRRQALARRLQSIRVTELTGRALRDAISAFDQANRMALVRRLALPLP